MLAYRERLVVPASWWLWSTTCVLLLGTTLWAGFSLLAGLLVYVVLEAACAALLLGWGSVRIEVIDRDVRAGPRCLPLDRIGAVAVLDTAQSAAMRGPRANAGAHMIIRPYLPRSVYIEVAGRPATEPYWLIGTRRPELLAHAIEAARSQAAGRQAPCDDAAGDQVPQAGAAEGRRNSLHGKDGNAS